MQSLIDNVYGSWNSSFSISDELLMSSGQMPYFFFLDSVTNFIFKGWSTTTLGGFVGTLFAVVLLVFLNETTKVIKVQLSKLAKKNETISAEDEERLQSPLVRSNSTPAEEHLKRQKRRKITVHIGHTFLHVTEHFFGYLLMLSVMTYNAWIAITVLIASGLGYFIFGLFRDLPQYKKVTHHHHHGTNQTNQNHGASQEGNNSPAGGSSAAVLPSCHDHIVVTGEADISATATDIDL